MKKVERTYRIVNKLGLHARPAARLVQTANGYQSEITIEREGQTANAKSIMGVLMLAAALGTELRLVAEGDDAEAALDALGAMIQDGFGEELA